MMFPSQLMLMTRLLLRIDDWGIVRVGVGIEIGGIAHVVQVKMIGSVAARANGGSETG